MPKTQSGLSTVVEHKLKILWKQNDNAHPTNKSKTAVILRFHCQIYHEAVKYKEENKLEQRWTVRRLDDHSTREMQKNCSLFVALQNLIFR